MRIPIRNKGDRPLTIFVELQCEQFEIPIGGEAIVRLEDGRPHSIDIDDAWVTIWDEGSDASVEIISSDDKRVDDALMYIGVWLHALGADDEAKLIAGTVDRLELSIGYLAARERVFGAFHAGLIRSKAPPTDDSDAGILRNDETFGPCFFAGETAARLNDIARKARSFPEIGGAPFDAEFMRSAFNRAMGPAKP